MYISSVLLGGFIFYLWKDASGKYSWVISWKDAVKFNTEDEAIEEGKTMFAKLVDREKVRAKKIA